MTVFLVDLETSAAKQLGRHLHGVTVVRFTADNQQVCSVGFDGCARFWSRDGQPGKVFEASAIRGLALTRDGKSLATGHEDGAVRQWNISDGQSSIFRGHGGFVEAIDYSDDDKWLASASRDNTIRIWNRDGSPVKVLRGHESWAIGVQWMPDGRRLFSCGIEGTIRLWNVDSGQTEWQSLFGESGGYVTLDVNGRIKFGDDKILDTDFVFFIEDEQGRLNLGQRSDVASAIQPVGNTTESAK